MIFRIVIRIYEHKKKPKIGLLLKILSKVFYSILRSFFINIPMVETVGNVVNVNFYLISSNSTSSILSVLFFLIGTAQPFDPQQPVFVMA